jgi:hypothetical protein
MEIRVGDAEARARAAREIEALLARRAAVASQRQEQ